jgi:hypothetical protein
MYKIGKFQVPLNQINNLSSIIVVKHFKTIKYL